MGNILHRDDCGFALYGPPALCTCERLFNGKPFKRTNRLTRDMPMTPIEKLGEALERCIVGCQGRRNAERAQAVLKVIEQQGWTLVPPKEDI